MLDWAIDQHTKEELREHHRRIVEAFRAMRPTDGHGRQQYDPMRADDPRVSYVCLEVGHHVSGSWIGSTTQDELRVIGWLGDVPQVCFCMCLKIRADSLIAFDCNLNTVLNQCLAACIRCMSLGCNRDQDWGSGWPHAAGAARTCS